MPGPDSSTSTTPTQQRTRQGCLSCRKRRRKCDEGKPRCQNCSQRGISCRYGVRLTFREGNLLNLMPGDAEALREATPKTYLNIRFVDGFEETEQLVDEAPGDSNSVPRSLTPDVRPPVQSQGDTERDRGPLEAPAQRYHDEEDDEIVLHQDLIEGNVVDERGNQSPAEYPSILGHSLEVPKHDSSNQLQPWSEIVPEQASSQISLPALPATAWSSIPRIDGTPGGDWRPLSTLSPTSNSPAQRGGPSPGLPLPTNERNGLLKFYIDEVAPRLDICTPLSSFGITIPTRARNYTPLLYAVLALAAQQRSACLQPESLNASQTSEMARSAIASIGPDMYSSREEVVAARTLLMISELFSARIRHWRGILEDRVNLLLVLGVDGFTDDLRGSASWISLRLDLAYSISSWRPLITPVEKWHKTSHSTPDDTYILSAEQGRSPEWTRRSILLCSQAAQLCLSADTSNITRSHSTTTAWTTLYQAIRSWHETLPSSMQPILTSSISSIPSAPPYSFPMILHTSCSDMYAAIMHHAASIFLLQSQPPGTAQQSYSLKSATWHAVQICGICIGNNASWSHDPTILAALIYVGRLISYREQRKELLEALQTLVAASGWQLGESVDQMVDGWRVDSGFQTQ